MPESVKESRSFYVKSMKEKVFDFMRKLPGANIHDLYFEFDKELKNGSVNKRVLQQYKYEFRKEYIHKHLVDWKQLEIVQNIINLKSVPAGQLTEEDRAALLYFEELIRCNVK